MGRFGVDFDWKPAGRGNGFGDAPLLCGGIVLTIKSQCTSCDVEVFKIAVVATSQRGMTARFHMQKGGT